VDQLEKHEYEVLEFRWVRTEAEELLGIKQD
jgi:hypothetical protein